MNVRRSKKSVKPRTAAALNRQQQNENELRCRGGKTTKCGGRVQRTHLRCRGGKTRQRRRGSPELILLPDPVKRITEQTRPNVRPATMGTELHGVIPDRDYTYSGSPSPRPTLSRRLPTVNPPPRPICAFQMRLYRALPSFLTYRRMHSSSEAMHADSQLMSAHECAPLHFGRVAMVSEQISECVKNETNPDSYEQCP